MAPTQASITHGPGGVPQKHSLLHPESPLAPFEPHAATVELAKGTKLGGYELVMRIGRGGMASVWLARPVTDRAKPERLVAVKALLPMLAGEHRFVDMFLDEVRLVRAIRHPNVVDVYAAGKQNGHMWMAMEWLEGESLHGIIAEAGKRHTIPAEIAVRIIADLAAGLHAAHELRDENGVPLNLVHRDVSPHNVLIGTKGQVKLVDFGVAKALDRISEKTRTGHLKGKFGYMSPEQVMGRGVDRRSDVFALGIVLYELTTGCRLFRGKHEMHTLDLVTRAHVPPPAGLDPGYPAALQAVVLKALARDPNDRYQTAVELESALRGYLKSECILVPQCGVASLLMRVMGRQIEERRRAIESALQSRQSTEPDLSPLPSTMFRASASSTMGSPSESGTPTSRRSSVSQVGAVSRASPLPKNTSASKRWRALALALCLLASASAFFAYQAQRRTTILRSPPVTATAPARNTGPASVVEPPASGANTSDIPLINIQDLELESEPSGPTLPERDVPSGAE